MKGDKGGRDEGDIREGGMKGDKGGRDEGDIREGGMKGIRERG